MNHFGVLLAEELERQGYGLGELPDLLDEHGAHPYDALPGALAAVLTATPEEPGIGWHPGTWAALGRVLGDPPFQEVMLPLMWSFYFLDADVGSAA